jgi:hypothetical protein
MATSFSIIPRTNPEFVLTTGVFVSETEAVLFSCVFKLQLIHNIKKRVIFQMLFF